MTDLTRLLAAYDARRATGAPGLLATLVRVSGHSYRRPGARSLIDDDGRSVGALSAGCVEAELARAGRFRLAGRSALSLTYDFSDDDVDDSGARFASGCGGVLEVLLETLSEGPARASLDFIQDCLAHERAARLVTVHRSDVPEIPLGARVVYEPDGTPRALGSDALVACLDGVPPPGALRLVHGGRSVEALVECIVPPPCLFLCGAGSDAIAVAELAQTLGWTIVIAANDARSEMRRRFPRLECVDPLDAARFGARVARCARPVALVMSHSFERDRSALRTLLASKAPYIGVLGPRRRTQRLLRELSGAGGAIERVRAPVGLDVGAETPEEIALAALAEMQSVLNGRSARPLAERSGPIHAHDAR